MWTGATGAGVGVGGAAAGDEALVMYQEAEDGVLARWEGGARRLLRAVRPVSGGSG